MAAFSRWIKVTCIMCVLITAAEWVSSPSRLPHAIAEFALGFYNDTVFMLGGSGLTGPGGYQLTEWDMKAQTGSYNEGLPAYVNCFIGRCGTQQGDTLYIITPDDALHIFNMSTKQFTANWNNVELGPKNYQTHGSCITSTTDHLFMLGGSRRDTVPVQFNANFQILQLSTLTWLTREPDMNEIRYGMECIVHQDILWTIGGWSPTSGQTTQIEHIDITILTDAMDSAWLYSAPLTQASYHMHAVGVGDRIFIMGGYSGHTLFHILNITDHTMTLSPHRLAVGVGEGGVMLLNSVIYLFGGETDASSSKTNTWQYYDLRNNTPNASESPTSDPLATTLPPYPNSIEPTSDPTIDPSIYPSNSPSNVPSSSPSSLPSNLPSHVPSITGASLSPTAPSELPSLSPSNVPSQLPTDLPSNFPSNVPSNPSSLTSIYTISILCDEVHVCDINTTTITSQINATLIAYDYNANILSADIINTELVITLSIATDQHNPLIGETIEDRIEHELKDAYGGDIDV
eukprot:1051058_1